MTLYDFLPGESRRLLFPIVEGPDGKRQVKKNPQEAVTLGAFPDTLHDLGRAGRLTGEALGLWLRTKNQTEENESC